MELELFQNSWLNISLNGLQSNESNRLPGPCFYEKFYHAVTSSKALTNDDSNQAWKKYKISVAKWLERNVLSILKNTSGSPPKILSLGVGTGIIEAEWLRKGYEVYIQECQEISLASFLREFPSVTKYICDARTLPCEKDLFDAVLIISLDYAFDKSGYQALLKETCRVLKPGGTAVCYCVSNITARGLLGYLKRKVFFFRPKGVSIGYGRSVTEHVRLGSQVGLQATKIHGIEITDSPNESSSISVKQTRSPGDYVIFPISTPDVIVIFRKPIIELLEKI